LSLLRENGTELIPAAAPAGAALLEGWSDSGTWRIQLPWPEEVRVLPWDRAHEWKRFLDELTLPSPADSDHPSPFAGGWVGYLSYEAMACEEAVRPRETHPPEPAAFFALHRSGIAIGPDGRHLPFGPDVRQPLPAPAQSTMRAGAASVVDSFADGDYARAVRRIREAIRDGEVYQVNLTRSFTLPGRRDAAELYRALTGAQPPRSSAFLRGNGWTIASASPEVLLRFDRNSGVVESRPIKGTARRTAENDAAAIAALLASQKDASEHLMIVDVVRNDFGKIAPAGAVTVPHFRTVRSLEHLHHLESTVRATGLRDLALSELLGALAPAASITGAPKRAAVQMIRDVEPVPRGVYCGAIGYLDARGHSEFSVAIRTALVTAAGVRYHAGGGIVWDSDAESEDDETRVKSAAFFRFAGASS